MMKNLGAILSACVLISITSSGPAIANEAKKQDDPRKFFQFHRAGVTVAEALADYGYCSELSSEVQPNEDTVNYSQYTGGGLIGDLVGIVQKGVEQERMKAAALRKCMAMFGYDRYLQSEVDFNAAHAEPNSLNKIATAIAGPKPLSERMPK